MEGSGNNDIMQIGRVKGWISTRLVGWLVGWLDGGFRFRPDLAANTEYLNARYICHDDLVFEFFMDLCRF